VCTLETERCSKEGTIMNTTFPIAPATPVANAAASSASTATTRSPTDLGPNAFITLLTAQLQAQNPLNPMDPNQMVSELTSMNTLQEIIQIRQDMDSLAKPPVATPPTTGATTGPLHSSAASVASSPSTSNALAAGLAALTKSLGPSPASAFASPPPVALSNTNKSQLF